MRAVPTIGFTWWPARFADRSSCPPDAPPTRWTTRELERNRFRSADGRVDRSVPIVAGIRRRTVALSNSLNASPLSGPELSVATVMAGSLLDADKTGSAIPGTVPDAIVITTGIGHLRRRLPEVLEVADNGLSSLMREMLAEPGVRDVIRRFDERVGRFNTRIREVSLETPAYRSLESIPGIGPQVSTALVAAIGDGSDFRNGREFAAWVVVVGVVRLASIPPAGVRCCRGSANEANDIIARCSFTKLGRHYALHLGAQTATVDGRRRFSNAGFEPRHCRAGEQDSANSMGVVDLGSRLRSRGRVVDATRSPRRGRQRLRGQSQSDHKTGRPDTPEPVRAKAHQDRGVYLGGVCEFHRGPGGRKRTYLRTDTWQQPIFLRRPTLTCNLGADGWCGCGTGHCADAHSETALHGKDRTDEDAVVVTSHHTPSMAEPAICCQSPR